MVYGLMKPIIIFLAMYGAAACLSVPENDAIDLTAKAWVVEDINGKEVIERLQSTISFEKRGKVKGFTGCNNFFGDAKVKSPFITIHLKGITERACSDVVSNQERMFIQALGNVKSYKIKDGLLYLGSASGDAILRFWQREDIPD